MTFHSTVRGGLLAMVAAAVGMGACGANNLIGEVHGPADGSSGDEAGPSIDAGSSESIVIGGSGGYDGTGGTVVDAHPGTGGAPGIGGAGGARPGTGGAMLPGVGGRMSTDAGPAPAVDGSIASDALGGNCPITYPARGFFGQNVAFQQEATLTSVVRGLYTLAADVPAGFSLSFTITRLSSSAPGNNPSLGSIWYLGQSDFRFTAYDPANQNQLFMSRLAGRNEVEMSFDGAGQARIDYYECGSVTPTRIEIINWAP